MLAIALLCLGLAQAPRPDVLLIVLDDVAAGDLALYGGPVAMPHLEELASSGLRMERAYANPTCATTRRSLQTGKWWVTGNGLPCAAAEANTPALDATFLPEAMPGYAAAILGKWHLGGNQTGEAWECAPLTQGYAYWYEGSPANVEECGGTSYWSWTCAMATPTGCSSATSTVYEPFAVADKLVHCWALSAQPRMAVVNINLAHSPFHRPPRWILPPAYKPTPTARSKFEAMIVAYDDLVGYMLSVVDLKTTLVVVLGDNGTPPNVAPDSTKAKGTTFERGTRVPLIFAGAGVNGGRTEPDLVHVVDVWATCVEVAGGEGSADGVSLAPVLSNAAHPAQHLYVLAGNAWGTPEGDRASVSADGFKLRQLDTDGDMAVDVEQFYDLTADPAESSNLIADPDQADRIAAHRAFIEASAP